MKETFGKKLSDLRVDAETGLRELARLIDKSPGYLSDVEQDHVPPPSEDVILKMLRVKEGGIVEANNCKVALSIVEADDKEDTLNHNIVWICLPEAERPTFRSVSVP